MTKWRNMRIWDETLKKLSLLSRITGKSQVAVLDALVSESLEELKQSNPELVKIIHGQFKRQEPKPKGVGLVTNTSPS